MIIPLFVGRRRSVEGLDYVMESIDQKIILLAQKNPELEDPADSDLYQVGTLANVLQMLKLPDGTVKILAEGEARVKVLHTDIIVDQKKKRTSFKCKAEIIETIDSKSNYMYQSELTALRKTILEQFEDYVKHSKKIPQEIALLVYQIDDMSKFADTMSSYFSLKSVQKQQLLETFDIKERLEILLQFIYNEIDILKIQHKIRTRVKGQIEKTQREYYLNEQLKAIQHELHTTSEGLDEISEFERQIREKKLSPEARQKAHCEVRKLRTMNQVSAEAVIVRNYLDWLLNLPWNNPKKLKKNLPQAEEILAEHHYGLDKVKERIIEFLAVQARTNKMSGQILCFVGPPGVGKTSLGKSIAEATGREFHRIALGGVHDEAEIRGHRRTYLGSMPGKILQSMRKGETTNPIIFLDEIDKLGRDWRGDPSSALLEVLDPEQNAHFSDHYLELPFDLSEVMFIATANTLNIHPALLDRMEVIRLHGYTEDEKINIALKYLIPKQIKAHGLKSKEITFDPDSIITIIRLYTKEAGVRNLEREIAKICRKVVLEISKTTIKSIYIDAAKVAHYCGVPKYTYGMIEEESITGTTNGLAWTEFGGDLLKIEAILFPGAGKHTLTGQLGDIMQESIHAAISLIRARAKTFGIDDAIFKDKDIHVHVPEGAIPKDGPSAGIGMFAAILSATINQPIRNDIAMTGEITLRGKILPIGGLKEKLLAAHRGCIKTVLIPKENEKDLHEVPANIKQDLEIVLIEHVDQALSKIFCCELKLPYPALQVVAAP